MHPDNAIRICVPLSERTLTTLTAVSHKAVEIADLIELRVDGLDKDEMSKARLAALIESSSKPVILTFRATAEGGCRPITNEERLSFWQEHVSTTAALFDIEADLVEDLTALADDQQPDWSRVICSYHNFTALPENLTYIYEQMSFLPPRILKIAVKVNDIVDCLPLFQLLKRSRSDERELIAIAMGTAGVTTRILGPSRGSFLTYGALETDKETAPGQLTASDLRDVYRIEQIDQDTVICGLIGSPVMQSVSPHMHNAAFREARLNAVYIPFEVKDLAAFFARMVNPRNRELDWNLRGLSITAPHKVKVMDYLDMVDPTAQEIGAVNTVVLQDEQLIGYNTDADGFIKPLKQRIGELAGTRVAVIGTGGAAYAAIYALQGQRAEVTVCARNEERAESLCRRFNTSYAALATANFSGYDVVINATPLGTFGDLENETPAVLHQLTGVRMVYDLVYNPIETRLMKEARAAGCEVLGGLEMLVAQAQMQFKLWTNTDTLYELMYTSGKLALAKNYSQKRN